MPFERAGNILTESRDLVCRLLTFVPLYCAAWVLGREEDEDILDITAASQGLLSLLTGWATPFEDAINWL